MAPDRPTPFSSRHATARNAIDSDFPASARNGLLHVLHDLVRQRYVEGWIPLATELARIARHTPTPYESNRTQSHERARERVETILRELEWAKVFDFIERLFGHLATEVGHVTFNDGYEVEVPLPHVRGYIEGEVDRLFAEEGLGFEFSDGLIQRRGHRHTALRANHAVTAMGDPRLTSARTHYHKALQFFRHRSAPDYENCVKEAVCAVEAAGKALFPDAKASTLADLVKWLTSPTGVRMPKMLGQTFSGLYGFRNGGDGVGHGGATGGRATAAVAEYALSLAASQVIYLLDLARARDLDTPF